MANPLDESGEGWFSSRDAREKGMQGQVIYLPKAGDDWVILRIGIWAA
jgi:hypothetical protein